jgi:MATE family multidrug resistance protein
MAAGSLGTIICNFTGISLFVGLMTAQDTLSSQAYGAGRFAHIGILLQVCVLLSQQQRFN